MFISLSREFWWTKLYAVHGHVILMVLPKIWCRCHLNTPSSNAVISVKNILGWSRVSQVQWLLEQRCPRVECPGVETTYKLSARWNR